MSNGSDNPSCGYHGDLKEAVSTLEKEKELSLAWRSEVSVILRHLSEGQDKLDSTINAIQSDLHRRELEYVNKADCNALVAKSESAAQRTKDALKEADKDLLAYIDDKFYEAKVSLRWTIGTVVAITAVIVSALNWLI